MAGGAILDLNPSLIGYLGGYGRAAKSIGDSMVGVGQLQLDDKKRIEDERIRNATLNLATNADKRAQDAQDYTKQRDFETKNDKFNSNAANNAFLLGQDMPQEMSNEYAKLSLIDPATTAAMLKSDKEKYAGTAGGIIFNTGTGAIAGDYRDKSDSSGFGGKGVTHVDTIQGGKVMRTFMNPTTGETKSIVVGGTPTGVYGMQVADGIGDGNTAQRPKITNTTTQEIGGTNVMAKGGMPITFAKDPKIAAEQKKWALPIEGGGYYVPRDMTAAYKKAFPR